MLEPWNDDRVTQLKSLHEAGYSCSQMAAELGGTTRNAVIGKLHRMGICIPKGPKQPKPEREVRVSAGVAVQKINRGPKIKAAPFVCQEAADVIPLHLSIEDLTDETCKYPFGDGQITFCGHPVRSAPYCDAHRKVAYVAPQRRYTNKPTELGRALGGVFGRVA